MTDASLHAINLKEKSSNRSKRSIKNPCWLYSFSLREIVFLMMFAIAIVPIAIFYNWVERTSFENELKQVDENHLIIAKNLSSTLSRFAVDTFAVFDFVLAEESENGKYNELLKTFDICSIFVLAADNSLRTHIHGENKQPEGIPAPEIIAELRFLASEKPGKTVVSGIRQHNGSSHFFIAKIFEDGTLAFAPWSAQYMIELQRSIAFGELGHSMMVDHEGLVVAHPNPEWQRTTKDASKLPVVQAMLSGKTGVMQFYSPPMAADMIAGYTYVPETGWGVMVPQPITELQTKANDIQNAALLIAALVIVLATIVGFMFSRILTGPIVSLGTSVRGFANGNLSARIGSLPRYTPSEICGLAQTFDTMAEDLEKKKDQLIKVLHKEKQLSREWATLLIEAQRSDVVKSQFVSTVSHELRTPLTSIRGSVDLILSGKLGTVDPKIEAMLAIGQRNVQRLLLLVNDILDCGYLESGQMSLEQKSVLAEQIIFDAVGSNTPFCKSSEVELVSVPCSESFEVLIDDKRIQQVLSNLISNAAKFSHKRSSIELSMEKKGDYGIFHVKDSGIGISDEYRSRVFERFSQADSSDTRSAGGTGLGLSISKSIVECHGGTLEFESELGVGTTFSFTVPLSHRW